MADAERVEFRMTSAGTLETRPIAKAGTPWVSSAGSKAPPKPVWECKTNASGGETCIRRFLTDDGHMDLQAASKALTERNTRGGFWAVDAPTAKVSNKPWREDASLVAKWEAGRTEVAEAMRRPPSKPQLSETEKARQRLARLESEGRNR